jgi:hypothetical protein
MYLGVIFSGVSQFIGEQLLLKSFIYIVKIGRATELTLPSFWVLTQGIMLYNCVGWMLHLKGYSHEIGKPTIIFYLNVVSQ